MKYIAPLFLHTSFHCPNCGVLAEQTWATTVYGHYSKRQPNGQNANSQFLADNTCIVKCSHCGQFSFWRSEKMIYPLTGNVELANADLPPDILVDYNEARDIVNISPRGSSALLRLAIQKLCIHLGEKGKHINDDIASLVKKGLPVSLQQALDSVRVIGNNAVHPGLIDLNDKPETAFALFSFINII